ncbi:MAG: glycosyltransferase family 2 protein [Bacteroidaceae bacterium]|nr:glycosyltransferase family 2 protein [Bacteroidaceae bacterium]
MQPQISVIVPVYKAEKYLHRCIDSILSQTFTDFELVLVDDGSPDDSGVICDEYAKKDKRVKVIHKENGGVNSARLEGFKNSNGKFLVFVDSDDTLTDKALNILYNNIIEGYDVVKAGSTRINNNGEIIRKENFKIDKEIIEGRENIIEKIFSGETTPYLWGAIYKKSLFTDDFFHINIKANISNGEDWIINLLIAKKINRILCIKDIIYNYYINDDSATSSYIRSISYMERVDDVLRNEGIMAMPCLKDVIIIRYCLERIKAFMTPELGFNYKEYIQIKKLLSNSHNYQLIKERVNPNYIRLFNCMPLYYIYSRLYCFIFYVFKLHCKSRRILK